MPTPAIKRVIDLSDAIISLSRVDAKEALSSLLPPLLHEFKVTIKAVVELLQWLLNSYGPDADVFVLSTADRVCTVVRLGMDADMAQIENQSLGYKLVRASDGSVRRMPLTVQIGKICFWCESAPTKVPLLSCAGCDKVLYCSQRCQKIDWDAQHRDECKLKTAIHHASGATSVPAAELDLPVCPTRRLIETTKRKFMRVGFAEVHGLSIMRIVCLNQRGERTPLRTGWVCEVQMSSDSARTATMGPTAVSILQKASEGPRATPEVMRALKHLQKMSSRAHFSTTQFPIVKISANFFKKFFNISYLIRR
jgi:hypothetical protein